MQIYQTFFLQGDDFLDIQYRTDLTSKYTAFPFVYAFYIKSSSSFLSFPSFPSLLSYLYYLSFLPLR